MSGSDFWRGVTKRGAQARTTPEPAASPPLALVQMPSAAAGIDGATKKLLDELRSAVKAAGVEPDDPMMPLVTAFAQSIRFMAERGSMSDRVVTSASERIQAALVEARRTADAEAERFSGAILATETDIIRRIAGSIAASADKALTRRVKVFDRNTALWAAAALFGTAVACLVGGYVWGSNVASADIHETEAGLRAAFSNSAADANNWMLLMEWNDLSQALKSCGNANQAILDHGRRACAMPLWIEKPQAAKPEQLGQ